MLPELSLDSSPSFATSTQFERYKKPVRFSSSDSSSFMLLENSDSHPMMTKTLHRQQRDQQSESEGTSCCSVSTAVTSADVSTVTTTTTHPLHQALRDFSINAVLLGSRVELVNEILQLITPETARVVDDATGHLPLHVCCRAGLPYPVVERLVLVYPEALRTTTRDKRRLLPLHILCRYYAGTNRERTKVLSLLLRHYPEATRIETPSGELALHLLCQNYFCSTIHLALLVKYYPDAISKATNMKQRMNLPIHIACEKQYMVRERPKRNVVEDEPGSSSDEIIRFLVQRYPKCLAIPNGMGELPFHAAIRGFQSLDTLRFILQTYPKAISLCDAHGRTPLHIAVLQHEPCRMTISALLETHPSALKTVDQNGKSPRDYAQTHPTEWVRNMLLQFDNNHPSVNNNVEEISSRAAAAATTGRTHTL